MTDHCLYPRRKVIKLGGLGLLSSSFAPLLNCFANSQTTFVEPGGTPYQGTDEKLLDEIQRTSFDFFWFEASAKTGQVKDRALANGNDTRAMSSIAATGFGLTSLCIGDHRGFGASKEILERVRITLRFLANDLPHEHGFYYHFIHMETGARWEKTELSSIDTSLLLCGVLTARQYFADQEIKDLATKIYERVDWPWMLNGGTTLSMGWHPESGFLDARWEHYCELMMIYLLGIGSPTHPLSPDTWKAWTRPVIKYKGLEYISGNDPIFTHQYSQAWFDFRKKRDAYANYFENSITATKAHKLFAFRCATNFRTTAKTSGESVLPITRKATRPGAARRRKDRSMAASCRAQRAVRLLFFSTIASKFFAIFAGAIKKKRGRAMVSWMLSIRWTAGTTRMCWVSTWASLC